MVKCPTEQEIYDYLQRIEPHCGEQVDPLLLFSDSGEKYRLHADVNEQDDGYGYMWEWWVEKEDGYVDGGFVPANSAEEIHELAALILQSCAAIARKSDGPTA